MNLLLRAIFLGALISGTASAAIPLGGVFGDDVISLTYDPSDGRLGIDAAGKLVTTLQVDSESHSITGPDFVCDVTRVCLDAQSAARRFVLDTSGFSDFDFGRVMASDLTAESLSNDLTVVGSVLPDGGLGLVDLIIVPEPSSCMLMALGAAAAWLGRRS